MRGRIATEVDELRRLTKNLARRLKLSPIGLAREAVGRRLTKNLARRLKQINAQDVV